MTFSGSEVSPQITISGRNFAPQPAPSPDQVVVPGATGYDYGNELYVSDTDRGWTAGQYDGLGNGWDTVGLLVSTYTDTVIQTTLGSVYDDWTYQLKQGDSVTVHVHGATCMVAVDYSGQPSSCHN